MDNTVAIVLIICMTILFIAAMGFSSEKESSKVIKTFKKERVKTDKGSLDVIILPKELSAYHNVEIQQTIDGYKLIYWDESTDWDTYG